MQFSKIKSQNIKIENAKLKHKPTKKSKILKKLFTLLQTYEKNSAFFILVFWQIKKANNFSMELGSQICGRFFVGLCLSFEFLISMLTFGLWNNPFLNFHIKMIKIKVTQITSYSQFPASSVPP